jgi:hypothetical protein
MIGVPTLQRSTAQPKNPTLATIAYTCTLVFTNVCKCQRRCYVENAARSLALHRLGCLLLCEPANCIRASGRVRVRKDMPKMPHWLRDPLGGDPSALVNLIPAATTNGRYLIASCFAVSLHRSPLASKDLRTSYELPPSRHAPSPFGGPMPLAAHPAARPAIHPAAFPPALLPRGPRLFMDLLKVLGRADGRMKGRIP